MVTYSGQKGRDSVWSFGMTLKLQESERMVLVNRQEARAGEIPECLPSCGKDFAFNDGNGTTKEQGFRHLFSL